MRCKWVVIFFSLASCFSFADQIQLKNGDKFTGKITKLDSGKVTIQTDFADEISVKWDKIAKLTPTRLSTAWSESEDSHREQY